jgi:hypothetical protein
VQRFLRIILVLALAAFSVLAASSTDPNKPVHVRQYTRKDGTVVQAHDRSLPGSGVHSTAPKSSGATGSSRHSQTIPTGPATQHPAAPAAVRSQPSTPQASADLARDSRGRIARSASAKHAFEASHPCPATRSTSGPCNGYVIDHVKPLACGGADAPVNMQWQTEAEAKAKDRTERQGCSAR